MISLIIPHVPFSTQADEMLERCLQSLKGYDELILVINDGIGYGKAFNRGFKYAKGDYLLAVSNDTTLINGDLKDMCKPDVVTYSANQQWGCFFCLPKSVYEKVGGFDERFEGAYWEDNDYLHRLHLANIQVQRVSTVHITHEGGTTVKAIMNESDLHAKNREVFDRKWKSQ